MGWISAEILAFCRVTGTNPVDVDDSVFVTEVYSISRVCLALAALYGSLSRVEEGHGIRLDVVKACRFPSPLIKPDVRVSRIRLSDWLHRTAHGGGPIWTRRR